MGFTLTELLVAAFIGMITATVAGQALVSHLESSEKAEAMERQRNDWSRAASFIEAEIALSERLITDSSNVLIPSSCPINTSNTSSEFRFAIDMRRDLPLAIYAVKPSTSDWLPNNTLWRCGPALEDDGSYNNSLEWSPILDGLDGNSTDGGFTVTSNDGKYASFTLALKGHATVKYGSVTGARSRISPLYSRPSDGSLCDASNLVNVPGKAGEADDITVPIANIKAGEDVLVCGYGGGDKITGSDANDIIEAGDNGSSLLNGDAGNDFLRGTNNADTLNGGDGTDVLVGRGGNDSLNGGGGDKNIYLPGTGADTINGGPGLDIVFFEGNRSNYGTAGCTKTQCTITQADQENQTLKNVEILIFNDARLDLPN